MSIVKMRAGSVMIPVEITPAGRNLEFKFPYNPKLLEEIKAMEGAKWHGFDENNPRKIWSVPASARNLFAIDYLSGKNPYAVYKQPLPPFPAKRKIYQHQAEMCSHVIIRRYCVLAAEMGTGKTLTIIECMEYFKEHEGWDNWWYVAPKFALEATKLEFKKWNSLVIPKFVTYEQLTKLMENWVDGDIPPQAVVFDESSKVKNPNAKRSQAAKALAYGVKEHWGNSGVVVPMSGTPAPKSPIDWWHQCEIACPGFIKEGTIEKFKKRYAIIVEKETSSGGSFPQLVSWRDSEDKCNVCGVKKDEHICVEDHDYVKGVNEVSALYTRLDGLVKVVNKKECLDLPDKIYREINLEPTPEINRVAKTIAKMAPRVITAHTLLRELSDGFQYSEEVVGKTECTACKGSKVMQDCNAEGESVIVACAVCEGTGEMKKVVRVANRVPCPKDDALMELLEEHEDFKRIVVYAGFTESINRVRDICLGAQWDVILVDGSRREVMAPDGKLIAVENVLEYFADLDNNRKIAFVGHPASSGYGVTLTASPSIVYFSNDFNYESRAQSEDRIYRIGMRGCNIIDLFHLPSDRMVRDNLKLKKRLEDMTLNRLQELF